MKLSFFILYAFCPVVLIMGHYVDSITPLEPPPVVEFTDDERAQIRERTQEIDKELQENRAKIEEILSQFPESNKVVQALDKYRYGSDLEALKYLEGHLDRDSSHALSIVEKIKLDERSIAILKKFIEETDSEYRGQALLKLARLPLFEDLKDNVVLGMEAYFLRVEKENYGNINSLDSSARMALEIYKNNLEYREKRRGFIRGKVDKYRELPEGNDSNLKQSESGGVSKRTNELNNHTDNKANRIIIWMLLCGALFLILSVLYVASRIKN